MIQLISQVSLKGGKQIKKRMLINVHYQRYNYVDDTVRTERPV